MDIGEITKGLDKVNSYRISITVNGVEQTKGVVVTKPVLSRDITISGGTRIVVIGSEASVATGNEPLKSVPASRERDVRCVRPDAYGGRVLRPGMGPESLDKGAEQKNGVRPITS